MARRWLEARQELGAARMEPARVRAPNFRLSPSASAAHPWRMSFSPFHLLALLLLPLGAFAARVPAWTADDFTTVSTPASPRVAWAAQRDGHALNLAIEVEPWAGAKIPPVVQLGVAAGRKLTLKGEQGFATKAGALRFDFPIRDTQLAGTEADWKKLRFAFAVTWPGEFPDTQRTHSVVLTERGLEERPMPSDTDRQRERFRHLDAHAPHAALSSAEADWQPLDLVEHTAAIADRRNRLAIALAQPMDGKATLVIEDTDGQRVRNLIAGKPLAKGPQRIAWDGLDEAGRVVPPGEYRWRAISHPGIAPEYLFSFCNDGTPPWRTGSGQDMWGPDHSTLQAAAAGKDWTFFAGSVAESGYPIVAVDQAGTKQQHYIAPMGTGIETVQLATAGETLFAAHDGFVWGDHIDKQKPDWKGAETLTLCRFDIASGKLIEFPGGKKFAVIATTEVGPGSANPQFTGHALAGLAALGDRLYISNRATNTILVLDAQTAEHLSELKLDEPGALAVDGGNLLAVSGTSLVRIDPATGAVTPLELDAPLSAIAGLALDAAGRIYASDPGEHIVQVIGAEGKLVRTIGQPRQEAGYAGEYRANYLVNPRGLAVAANGWLWITEDRWNPKRLTAWDTANWQLVREKFGPTGYGANGGGFDPADPALWCGQNALWRLDFAAHSAKPFAILEPEGGKLESIMHRSFIHAGGSTFVVSFGKVTGIAALEGDGRLRPLAALSSCHTFSFAYDWHPPQPFIDAFNRAYPEMLKRKTERGAHAEKGPAMMWVDQNGDGEMQADEFNFSTDAQSFAGAYWGHDFRDLTLRVPATVRGKRVLVTLPPQGEWQPGGVLKYPALNAALAQAVPIDLNRNEVETATDRFGDLLCNSDPEMKCFAPDGRVRWTYPNRWSGVHGSHDAPLPERGVMQGALFFLGMTPLDAESDVFVINGNHGRFFALTSDGLYLDEFFKDVRTGGALDAQMIGGECFGGFFAKSETDGGYYLQSGHTDYRIFRLNGLRECARSQGGISVSAEQARAAANNANRQAMAVNVAREAVLPFVIKAPVIDGEDNDWPGVPVIHWDKSGKFPVTVRASLDAQNLNLFYDVQDDSPWVNTGKDATLLFKTGDSVDLQIGSDANADPKRTGPVPGDLRLLIAPFQGRDIAVLYQHRVPGAKSPATFTSPWRSEKVDVVRVLDAAKISVKRGDGRYRVEAAIPLAELGLTMAAGRTLRADFGVLYGDPSGTVTLLRSYWSNQATNLVNDVPGEIMLSPNRWGTVTFGGGK